MHDFDNFDDDFSDDFEGDSGDDGNSMDADSFEDSFDDDFGPEDSCNDSPEIQGDSGHEGGGIDFGWEDMAVIGGMAEEFAEEEAERRELEKKMDDDMGVSDRDSKT